MKKVTLKMISIIFIIVIITTGLVLLNSRIMKKEKVTIKTMTENEEVSNLQAQINQLNASHNEYARNVQAYKSKIATAITNQGVNTSVDATAEVMAENIEKILQVRTADATATADNITSGKTAYVNGELITGNGTDNDYYYDQGCGDGTIKVAQINQNATSFTPFVEGGRRYPYRQSSVFTASVSQDKNITFVIRSADTSNYYFDLGVYDLTTKKFHESATWRASGTYGYYEQYVIPFIAGHSYCFYCGINITQAYAFYVGTL